MATAQKAARSVPDNEKRQIQSYMTNLLFLSQEAERDGLTWIAKICENALSLLTAQASKKAIPATELLDASLCEALRFLVTFLSMPSGPRKEIVRHISRYEEETAAAPMPRRVRKRSAA